MKKYLSLNYLKRAVAFATLFAVFSNTALASIYYVDSNADTDPNTCVAGDLINDGNCTFRDAITTAGGNDTIRFLNNTMVVDSSGGSTSHSVNLMGGLTIDGIGDVADGTAGHTIDFDGAGHGLGASSNFLDVVGSNFTLKGVHIFNYNGNAIHLENGANIANIRDNVIGQNSSGTGTGNMYGIYNSGSASTIIQNNVISNNTQSGIRFSSAPNAADTIIIGNRIGVDGILTPGENTLSATGGITAVANHGSGIDVRSGKFEGIGTGLKIGGSLAADRNIISGNSGSALDVVGGEGTISGTVTVQNNYIGVGKDGTTPLPNNALSTTFGAINEVEIGTSANWTIKDNVISGNDGAGIAIRSGGTATIQGNKIGLKDNSPTNTVLGNAGPGIVVDSSTVLVGTDSNGSNDATEGNIVVGNGGNGIEISGTDTLSATVAGNQVGIVLAGALGATGNAGDGMKINGTSLTTANIGTVAPTPADGRNVIANNTGSGIRIAATGGNFATPAAVTIANNMIGTDNGTTDAHNNGEGILADASSGVSNLTIGTYGSDANQKNIIGMNRIEGARTDRGEISIVSAVKTLIIAGNRIFGNTNALYGTNGIMVNNTLDTNLSSIMIGGSDCSTDAHATQNTSIKRNYLVNMVIDAINIQSVSSTGYNVPLTIQCNQIGIKENDTAGANGLNGIDIGKAGEILIKDNTVGNSGTAGVFMSGGGSSAGTKLEFYGNKIGTDKTGLLPEPNATDLTIQTSSLAVTGLIPIPVIIGGATADLANVFAAANGTHEAVALGNLAAADTPVVFKGNYVGVCADPFGKGTINNTNLAACKSANNGIAIASGAVTIGGANNIDEVAGTLGEGNVIANNASQGVRYFGGVGSSLIFKGNIVGLIKATTDSAYNVVAANTNAGLSLYGSAGAVTVGGTGGAHASSYRNVISAGGISFSNASTSNATIVNNYFGTDWAGTARMAGIATGDQISISAGGTITVGGTGADEGNLIAPNVQNGGGGINVNSGYTGTITLLKNIFGLKADGVTAFSNNDILLSIDDAAATVNIGDGTTAGRNIFAGSALYAVMVTSATAVNVLDNYFGFASDGTTSIPNATDTATILAFPAPVAEMWFNTGSGAVHLAGNKINNSTHAGVAFTTVTPESTLTTGNTWNGTTFHYWEKYVSSVLTDFAPQAESTPAPSGGGSLPSHDEPPVRITPPIKILDVPVIPEPIITPEPVVTLEPVVTPEPDTTTPTPVDNTDKNFKDFVIKEGMKDAVSVTTDTFLGKNEINLDLLIKSVPKTGDNSGNESKTPEQKTINEGFKKISSGGSLSNSEKKNIERTAGEVLHKSVSDLFQKAKIGGVAAPIISVSLSNGKVKKLDENTDIQFALDAKEALESQTRADKDGENVAYFTSYSVIDDSNVSALLQIMEGGKFGDKDAAGKIFFNGFAGLSADSVESLIPKKSEITNIPEGTESAPKFLLWIAGPKAGEDVTVYAVDKVDPKDPKTWKIYNLGKYTIDAGHKAAVPLDLTDKMGADVKKLTIIVQNEKKEGSAREITLNKKEVMQQNNVSLKNGDVITFADLTDTGRMIVKSGILKAQSNKITNDETITIRGYAKPGSVVFVTWKSVLMTSTVIADASQGYYEVQAPKELDKGDHTAYATSYDKDKKTASNFTQLLFSKFL